MICSSTNLKSGIKNWLNLINPLKISDIGSSLKFCYLAEGKYNIYQDRHQPWSGTQPQDIVF